MQLLNKMQLHQSPKCSEMFNIEQQQNEISQNNQLLEKTRYFGMYLNSIVLFST